MNSIKNITFKEEKINNAVISQPTSNGQMVSKIELTVRKNGEKVEVVDKKSKLLSTKGVAEDQKINDWNDYF